MVHRTFLREIEHAVELTDLCAIQFRLVHDGAAYQSSPSDTF